MALNKEYHLINATNLEYILYLISWQAMKSQLERSQVKFHKVWKKGSWKKKKNTHKNWKVQRTKILLGRTLIIQSFCHAKDNIQ